MMIFTSPSPPAPLRMYFVPGGHGRLIKAIVSFQKGHYAQNIENRLNINPKGICAPLALYSIYAAHTARLPSDKDFAPVSTETFFMDWLALQQPNYIQNLMIFYDQSVAYHQVLKKWIAGRSELSFSQQHKIHRRQLAILDFIFSLSRPIRSHPAVDSNSVLLASGIDCFRAIGFEDYAEILIEFDARYTHKNIFDLKSYNCFFGMHDAYYLIVFADHACAVHVYGGRLYIFDSNVGFAPIERMLHGENNFTKILTKSQHLVIFALRPKGTQCREENDVRKKFAYYQLYLKKAMTPQRAAKFFMYVALGLSTKSFRQYIQEYERLYDKKRIAQISAERRCLPPLWMDHQAESTELFLSHIPVLKTFWSKYFAHYMLEGNLEALQIQERILVKKKKEYYLTYSIKNFFMKYIEEKEPYGNFINGMSMVFGYSDIYQWLLRWMLEHAVILPWEKIVKKIRGLYIPLLPEWQKNLRSLFFKTDPFAYHQYLENRLNITHGMDLTIGLFFQQRSEYSVKTESLYKRIYRILAQKYKHTMAFKMFRTTCPLEADRLATLNPSSELSNSSGCEILEPPIFMLPPLIHSCTPPLEKTAQNPTHTARLKPRSKSF